MFWVFVFPLLMAIGLGVAFRSRPPDVPRVAVVTRRARGSASDSRAAREQAALRAERLPSEDARRALAAGKVDLVVEWTR